jgi:flavin-dependent dehydrogenase
MTGSLSGSDDTFDAVVLGAGSAGSAAALFLQQAGLRTALVDRRPMERAGAGWVNGVPAWFFELVGLPRPEGAELYEAEPLTHYVTREREVRFAFKNPFDNVDMRRLITRLQAGARAAGVEVIGEHALLDVELSEGRPRAITLEALGQHPSGPGRRRLSARLFVDATGLAQALLRRVPLLAERCPPVEVADRCSAVQAVCPIQDVQAAQAWLDSYGVAPGEAVNGFGIDGGYSTFIVATDAALSEAHIVLGTAPAEPSDRGKALFARFRDELPWLGDPTGFGFGEIPLRRPYARLAVPGLAVIGDAAGMVYSVHGSGVGMGIAAARYVADAAAAAKTIASDPGGLEATWAYQARFQGHFGGRLAVMGVMRRAFQSMTGDEVNRLFEAGLLGRDAMYGGIAQANPKVSFSDLRQMIGGLAREPALGARVMKSAALVAPLLGLYAMYPVRPNEARLDRWSRAVEALAGPS